MPPPSVNKAAHYGFETQRRSPNQGYHYTQKGHVSSKLKNKILKTVKEEILEPKILITNMSIETGVLSDKLKITLVTPFHKAKGQKSDK